MTTREILLKIIESPAGNDKMELASILSVEGSTCTVNIESSDTEISGVRLQAFDANGFLLKPSIGSKVYIIPYFSDFFVIMFSSIDEITLLDGSFGGLTKTQELKTQLDKTNQVVNALVNSLTTWTPVANDGGAALKAFAISALAGKAVGDYTDIENTSINHGQI